ncbi:hypothetical protein CCUS01_00807 [Colletotrichum cuscutae]|uniref:Uncharacterized protein n=1 Tax=Colletotrichum cuscutae TaxID=1209917 RepID=A0AAI9V6X3_9PEZI|nr:hypothetical protein CCUS01_00807 [Colletotrichum cuscutae]
MPSALVGRRLSILALGATLKISPHGGRCGGVVANASVVTTVFVMWREGTRSKSIGSVLILVLGLLQIPMADSGK